MDPIKEEPPKDQTQRFRHLRNPRILGALEGEEQSGLQQRGQAGGRDRELDTGGRSMLDSDRERNSG